MAWNNQGGSGGPWGNGGSGGGGRGGNQPPDLEQFLKKSQENLKKMMPGGPKNFKLIPLLLGFLGLLWVSSGFYIVREGEQGAVLRFGEWIKTADAGINYHLPSPIETVIVRKVDKINRIDSGIAQTFGAGRVEETENLMLTGDENIIAVNFTVHWFIKDIGKYLFKIMDPDLSVKKAADSAVREIIAQTPMAYAITKGRGEISDKAQDLLQGLLDEYNAGIQIQRVQLKSVDPPSQVIEAFRDVQRARADRESEINEARAYASKVVPEARGQAKEIVKKAQGYQEAKVREAQGRTTRYLALWEEYKMAPQVTRTRLQLETVQKVLQGMQKILIAPEAQGASGVLPYLPLDQLKAKPVVSPTQESDQ